jgi:hypothetical protein
VHVNGTDVDAELLEVLQPEPATGVIISGLGDADIRRARLTYGGLLGHDAALWRRAQATVTDPLPGLGAAEDLTLFPVDLDDYARPIVKAEADVVFTPSGFVPAGAWSTLQALLAAGRRTTLPEVRTLVPTDVQMLDSPHRGRFAEELAAADRPLALVFAARSQPFGAPGRVASLRAIVAALPDLAVLATEYLVAADVMARGATASVGFDKALRCPSRPEAPGGGGIAKGWLPGYFLRELWESRSPSVYADWYAASATVPYCKACGRDVEDFEASTEDRLFIRRHNVHALVELLAGLRYAADPQSVLRSERMTALQRHVDLHQFTDHHQTDPVLRRLAELDDPRGRTVLPSGAWSR